jgi:hypothetical protein
MFTTNHIRPRRIHIIAATALAGVIGTVGIVAAASNDNGQTTADDLSVTATSGADDTPADTPTDTSPTDPTDEPGAPPDAGPSGDADSTATTATTSTTSTQSETPEGVEPADEGDEDGSEAEPQVEGVDTPDDPPPPPPVGGPTKLTPVPKDPPPPSPIPGPTDLVTPPMDPGPEPIDDFAAPTDPTPWGGPGDFKVTPLPGYIGTITSGLTGCQLECVKTALLSANIMNANVALDVTTAVPVHFEVEVAETGGTWSKHFNNPGYDTEWSTTLAPLGPNTEYDLTLIAIDQEGHSKVYEHQFTTVAIVDGFASNAKGCALPCLTEGIVQPTGTPGKVEIHIESDSPAAMQVWVSTNAPTWVDDPAAKPAYGPVYDNENPSTSWTFDIDGLATGTTYHVVARAEDANGVDYQIGTFTTDHVPPANVLVTFEKIDVLYDGDKGTLNRGELSFTWGFDQVHIGSRGEQKMHFGVIDLHEYNSKWFSVDRGNGTLPNIMATASERDGLKSWNICEATTYDMPSSPVSNCTNERLNLAQSGDGITVADVEALPLCGEFGIETDHPATARCMAIGGVEGLGDDVPRFAVIVSLHIE